MATIRIPIDLRNPRVASLAGNAFFNVLALTNYDAGIWDFVKDVQGKVYGFVTVPFNINATPNAKIVISIAANATTGVTSLQASSKNLADAATYNVTFTAETRQDITVPATAYFRKDVSFTLTNAPAAKDELVVEIFHDGTQAADTLAVDTLLFDAWLEIDV